MRPRLLAILLVLVTAAQCLAQESATVSTGGARVGIGIIAGPDTTIFSGPLRLDGSIDYAAALNAEDSRGITADKNAASLLLRIRIVDPERPDNAKLRALALHLIGAEDKAANDVTWQNWKGFAHPKAGDISDSPTYGDRFTRAREHAWSASEMPEVAAWLESNKPCMAIAEEAAKRPRYWMPILHQAGDRNVLSVEVDLSSSRRLMNLRDGFCIRSMLKLQQGDADGAFHDLLVLQRLLTLMADGDYSNAFLWSQLRGGVCYTFWRVLAEAKPTSQQLRQWAVDLESIKPTEVDLRRLSRRPRYDFLSAAQELAQSYATTIKDPAAAKQLSQWADKAHLPMPDWNLILRKGNAFYDDLAQNLSALPQSRRTDAQKAFDRQLESISKLSGSYQGLDNTSPAWLLPRLGESNDDYNGRLSALVINMPLPDMRRMCRDISNNNERIEWTDKEGVALAEYRVDHGHYPANLQALVPKYVAKLPESSTPVVYEHRNTGYVVRRAIDYSPDMLRALAKRHLDYDPPDILIRTDQP